MSNRIKWIDNAKGCAIILVLLGHFLGCVELTSLIYVFHMPLFFFLSGLVFRIDKYTSFKEFFIKKIKTLMIPCILFNFLYWLWLVVKVFLLHKECNIVTSFLGIFIQCRRSNFDGEAWFISCIFCAEIILYVILKKVSDRKKQLLMFCITLIVGLFYCMKVNRTLPWNIDASLIAVFFMGLGYCVKDVVDKINKWYILSYIIMVVVALTNFKLNGNCRVEMWNNFYGNPILFLVGAICGIVGTIALAKMVNSKVLEFYGKNTLFIYGMQLIPKSIFTMLGYEYNLYDISAGRSLVIAIVVTIVFLLMTTPIIAPYNKFMKKIK